MRPVGRFDGVWYGRASAWCGCALLVLMAVAGRQVVLVTVIAVLLALIGFVLLLWYGPRSGGTTEPDRNGETGAVR